MERSLSLVHCPRPLRPAVVRPAAAAAGGPVHQPDQPAVSLCVGGWLSRICRRHPLSRAAHSGHAGQPPAPDRSGDWAVCTPPIGFFWGGTWVLANKNTEKAEAVGDIIEWITLDTSEDGLQYKWANGTLNGEGGTKDAVASGVVMSKSNGELDFLGGQNMFDAFVPANDYAKGTNLTQYDETINTYWRDQVRQYTAGEKSRDQAIADFKQQVADNLDVIVE